MCAALKNRMEAKRTTSKLYQEQSSHVEMVDSWLERILVEYISEFLQDMQVAASLPAAFQIQPLKT